MTITAKELTNQMIVADDLPDLFEYLKRNESGDAELFALLHADKVLYDHSAREWYLWRGPRWLDDEIIFQDGDE